MLRLEINGQYLINRKDPPLLPLKLTIMNGRDFIMVEYDPAVSDLHITTSPQVKVRGDAIGGPKT